MNYQQGVEYVKSLKTDPTGVKPGWKNRRHIATNRWRDPVPPKLSRDSHLKNPTSIAVCEIITSVELPGIDHFNGLIQVDEVGLWYTTNQEDDVDEAAERHSVIPWNMIVTMNLYRND
jgi:hypothetical protein